MSMKKVLLLMMVLFAATTATAATQTDTQTFDDLGWTGSYNSAGSSSCPLPDGWYRIYDNTSFPPEASKSKAHSGSYSVAMTGAMVQSKGYSATLVFPAQAGTVSAWALAYGSSQYVSVKFYKMTSTGEGTFSYGTELSSVGNDYLSKSEYKEVTATLDEDGYVGLKFCCAYVDDISNTYEVGPSTYSVGGTVKGANGLALSGATVSLTPGSYSATTDDSGAFTIADVPEGEYTATASLAGYTSASTSVSVAADVTGVALTLSPVVTTVSGIITKYNSDSSTSPLANATVVLRERTSQAEVASTVSGADGSFSISITGAIAADGKYQLVPTHAYYKFAYECQNVTLTEGQTTSDVSITLDPIKRKYVFTVTDAATAEPINDATVTVSADGSEATAAKNNYNGTYTYSGEAEWVAGISSFAATIACDGYKTQTATFTFDDEPLAIALQPYAATVFSGEVSDSDAEILVPLANVCLYAYNEGTDDYTLVGTTVTDEEGAFTLSLSGEVVSTYKLTVTCEHYRDFELIIENVEREGSYYRICDLTPIYYTYTFTINDAQTGEAVPTADAEVTVTAPDGHFTTVVNVGAGTWSLVEAEYDLSDQEYVLHATIPGYEPLEYSFTIEGEETTETLTVDPIMYTFTATVADLDTDLAIADAVITIGNEALQPDAEGIYTYAVRALDYEAGTELTATATAEKYENAEFTFTFSAEQPTVNHAFLLKHVAGVSDINADNSGVQLRGGNLYISGDARVYDTMGRLVRNVRGASGEAVNLRPGVYIVNGSKVRIY